MTGRLRLHLLGLPHTCTVRDDFYWCAYTQKVRKMATMMQRAGIEVVLYAGEDNDAECSEHVCVVTKDLQQEWFGHYDWSRDVFNEFDPTFRWWDHMNRSCIETMRTRIEPGDICGITMGISQRPVGDFAGSMGAFVVEVGVGYSGVFAPYRVFESHAWRHYLAAREPTDTVRLYDDVIPNYFEADDFPLGDGSGGYYLFMGRLTERKGPHVAALACERIGAKLLVAGQGDYPLPGDVEYLGVVGPKERADLMGDAIAVFCPSLYLEPFCGVSVESQLTGTPVIASNWGALVENVTRGGYRCSTLAEFADAAEAAAELTGHEARVSIRKWALERWSTEAVAPQFVRYFERLQGLRGQGWYS